MIPSVWVLVVAATLNMNGLVRHHAVVEDTYKTEKECLASKYAKDVGSTTDKNDVPKEITRYGGSCVEVKLDIVNNKGLGG